MKKVAQTRVFATISTKYNDDMGIFGFGIGRAAYYHFFSLNFNIHEKWNSKNATKKRKIFFFYIFFTISRLKLFKNG